MLPAREPEPDDDERPDPEQLLGELAAAQNRIASRSQLRTIGIARHRVRSEIRARRWQAAGPRVVVLHTGPLTKAERWWVGVLHCGEGSALCGLTAAEAAGLKGYASDVVHVAVSRGARVPSLEHAGIQLHVHRLRRLSEADVHPARAPRRLRIARAVQDAASWAPNDRDAIAVLAAAVQQRLTPVAALRAELARTSRIARRQLIRETLDDIEGGSHSLPEVEFVRLVRRGGLPPPTRQRVLQRANGRYYLDGDWEEYGTSAEIDGIQHEEFRQRDHDRERRNEITADGRRVLNFVSYDIRHCDTHVADVIARSLRTGGWTG